MTYCSFEPQTQFTIKPKFKFEKRRSFQCNLNEPFLFIFMCFGTALNTAKEKKATLFSLHSMDCYFVFFRMMGGEIALCSLLAS